MARFILITIHNDSSKGITYSIAFSNEVDSKLKSLCKFPGITVIVVDTSNSTSYRL